MFIGVVRRGGILCLNWRSQERGNPCVHWRGQERGVIDVVRRRVIPFVH